MTEPAPTWGDIYSDFSQLGRKEFMYDEHFYPDAPPDWVVEQAAERPTTLTTTFFRSSDLEVFAAEVAPDLQEALGRRLNIGQIACSDGEETWTVAALLEKAGVDFTIAGFDIHRGSLADADRAVYPNFRNVQKERAEKLGVAHLFEQVDPTHIRPVAALRDRATFSHYDARRQQLPGGPYDVLIAKNLFFHYANPVRDRMLSNILAALDTAHGVLIFDPPVAAIAEPTYIPWRRGLAHRFGLTLLDSQQDTGNAIRRYRPKPYTTPVQSTLAERATIAPDGNTVANIGACVLDAVNSIPFPEIQAAQDKLVASRDILEDTVGYIHLRERFSTLNLAFSRLRAIEDLLYKATSDFDNYLADIGYDGSRAPHEQVG
ncbi:MAG TPA: CheR family methyltransferase [Patescibacteria group bacterium]|nr:CheR family methyltransferase [Patescibacteria group bacterium]